MEIEVEKGRPLTKSENMLLLDLVENSKIITLRTTNATSNRLKTAEWLRLAAKFNATNTSCPRTPRQLRLKWENLKKNSRRRNTKIKMNKVDGDPLYYIPPDDVLDRVANILESVKTQRKAPQESESETQCDDDDEFAEQNSLTCDIAECDILIDETRRDSLTSTTKKIKENATCPQNTIKNRTSSEDDQSSTAVDINGCQYFGQFVSNELLRFDISKRYHIMQNIIELLKQ